MNCINCGKPLESGTKCRSCGYDEMSVEMTVLMPFELDADEISEITAHIIMEQSAKEAAKVLKPIKPGAAPAAAAKSAEPPKNRAARKPAEMPKLVEVPNTPASSKNSEEPKTAKAPEPPKAQ